MCVLDFPAGPGSETLAHFLEPTAGRVWGVQEDESGDCRLLGCRDRRDFISLCGGLARALLGGCRGGLLAGSREGTGSRLLAVRLPRPHIDAAGYGHGDRYPDLSRGGAAPGQDCEHRGNGADLAQSGKTKTPDPASSS